MGTSGSAAQVQARLGRYELLARLATGGMGEIFLSRLEGAAGFEKLYVVKRILPHLADDARFRQMLIAEARIASQMSHPNICQVYELGETDGQLYIVMEYLEGISLLPLLRRFSKSGVPLELGFVAGVIQQTTEALNYAHDLKDRGGETMGIVHRDVTPSNIFLTEPGVAKVLDFGIAKAKGASTQTQEGTVKGKYAYMAPEQLRGGAIDRRVDVFALGVVLFEMLALRRLFQRKTDYLTFRAVMEQPIPDVRRYRPDCPETLVDVLGRALDRDPANRFDTARQFGTAVLDALAPYQRPWTQGEISDFVHQHFAPDLAKRSNQVSAVIHRAPPGAASRTTMPLLAHDDGQASDTESGDDDEFPSVETEVEGAPPWMPPPPPPLHASASGDFSVGGTPQPFGVETTGSAPSLQPLRASSPVPVPDVTASQVVVVRPQRSLMWPMVAVAMVAIAGGALFLVWQQMQQQQQPAKIEIMQQRSDAPPERLDPDPLPRDDTPPDPVNPSDPPDRTGPRPTPRTPPDKGKKPTDPYGAAIAGRKAQLVQCLGDHRDAIPTEEIIANIRVAPTGKATGVSLLPDRINAAPLGACMRNVLMGISYPKAANAIEFKVPLKPRAG
jgi:eukaryotic-like serine/threonine-protein kinase